MAGDDVAAEAAEQFDGIIDDLAPRGVLPGALFGSRSLTYEGKAFAAFGAQRMAIKLGAGTPAHAAALALEGAEPFDPSGKGRPMKDWVMVPAAHHATWPRFAEAALDVMIDARRA